MPGDCLPSTRCPFPTIWDSGAGHREGLNSLGSGSLGTAGCTQGQKKAPGLGHYWSRVCGLLLWWCRPAPPVAEGPAARSRGSCSLPRPMAQAADSSHLSIEASGLEHGVFLGVASGSEHWLVSPKGKYPKVWECDQSNGSGALRALVPAPISPLQHHLGRHNLHSKTPPPSLFCILFLWPCSASSKQTFPSLVQNLALLVP